MYGHRNRWVDVVVGACGSSVLFVTSSYREGAIRNLKRELKFEVVVLGSQIESVTWVMLYDE